MIYYTNEAREAAIKDIERLVIKLNATIPTDTFTLGDIAQTVNHLHTLKTAIRYEVEDSKKHRRISK